MTSLQDIDPRRRSPAASFVQVPFLIWGVPMDLPKERYPESVTRVDELLCKDDNCRLRASRPTQGKIPTLTSSG